MNTLLCNKSLIPIKSYGSHFHDSWEIILHLTGSIKCLISGIEYDIHEGDIMVIEPGAVHSESSGESFTDMYVQAKSLDFKGTFVTSDYDGAIRTLFDMLHKNFTSDGGNEIADGLLDTICLYIKRNSESVYKYSFTEKLKSVICENMENPYFSISSFIKEMGYNVDYVRRCFKKETKQTPHEYMQSLRLNHAKKLLSYETYISIENVAAHCGFNDSFYFSKVFKSEFGLSPREYRKKSLQQ